MDLVALGVALLLNPLLLFTGVEGSLTQLLQMPRSSRGRGRSSLRGRTNSHRNLTTSTASRRSFSSNARTSISGQGESVQRTLRGNPRSSGAETSTPRPFSSFVLGDHVLNDEAEELLDHVIVAIDVKEKGNLGCAYYVTREERLFCMEDIPADDSESVERLTTDLQPTIVVLSPRADALVHLDTTSRMRRSTSLVDHDQTNPPLPYQIELRPTQEFSYEGALNKLSNLQDLVSEAAVKFLVPGENTDAEDNFSIDEIGLSIKRGRLLQISAWLNLENKISLGCVGAVLAYLQRQRATEYLQDDPTLYLAYRIRYIEMFTFKSTMFVNTETLSSLQLIQPESHPNTFNQGPGTTGSKEPLSVFGLFHYNARTSQGKSRLRQLILRPSMDVEVITDRLNFVSIFTRPDNLCVTKKISKSLSKIKNMRNIMTMLHKGVDGGAGSRVNFKSGVWPSLLEFCYHSFDIVEALREVLGVEASPLCERVAEELDRIHLQRIGRMIHDVVDLESSSEQNRTVMKRGVDENLDKIKDVYDGMDELLSRTALEIARTVPADIDCTINVIFFPQLGFHITVPLDEATGQAVWGGDVYAWEQMFTTSNQVYFKDDKMREMDQDLGDLWASICDIEIELAHELAQKVLMNETLLVRSSDLCGELDCLLALAHGAIEHKLTRPNITSQNVIDIKGGRHILQEMTVPCYVPNDTLLVGDAKIDDQGPNILMLTGPNYSGKSVYQKQVALIVYMAQLGSFVPAETCRVGITDKILTRITTRETVSKSQSAFMIDLQQIALALNSYTSRSLIIIDEFGKGTDSCDGAGLAAGTFQHLLLLKNQCPKVLAATHFHEIFDLNLFDDNPRIAFCHMEVHVDRRRDGKVGSHWCDVTYLYNLRQGRSILSYGAQCAAINGIPDQIVGRAVELSECMRLGEDLVAACSAMTEHEMDDLADAEAVSRAFLSQDLDERYDIMEMLDATLNAASFMESGSETISSGEVTATHS